MRNLIGFIRQEKGGLAILFAIILPFIISCCALAFDGARIMTKRARLADALNEAALAIATAGSAEPTKDEKAKLEKMLANYLKAYLPNEEITTSKIDITFASDALTGKNLPVYTIDAAIKVKTILPLDIFPAFSPTLDLNNQGKVRKGLQDLGLPADYVFVVDFSGSMDSPSAQPGMTRIELLKKVVSEVTAAALKAYPETTFALVPFDMGVPVKYHKSHVISGGIGDDDGIAIGTPGSPPTPIDYETNELGGVINGCSVVMVPKKIIHPKLGIEVGYDIDYDFWSYPLYGLINIPAITNNTTTITPYTLDQVTKMLDNQRFAYYRDYVIPSMRFKLGRAATWQDLVDVGWCEDNGKELPGRARYSCEKDKSRFIFAPENLKKIEEQFRQARQAFATAQNKYSIFNTEMIDIEATLEGMFDKKNIITFPMRYIRSHEYGMYMCYNAGDQVDPIGMNHLETVVYHTYLIEPTNDLAVLNEFQNMKPSGNTSSSSGLLRAVPEMLKGENPRKVLIVISDGDDTPTDNEKITDLLHMRPAGDNVCDRIRAGVKSRTDAEAVDIYFISVTNEEHRRKFWANYCTGEDNAFIATNYADLMDKLVEIMSGYEETGYFYN